MKNCLILFFFCFASAGFSQNLVPNPSFEDAVMCPTFVGALENCAHWKVFRDSPDYMNECASIWQLQVPYNYFGYQEASSGVAYCGLYTMGIEDYREIIGVRLNAQLEIGEKYYVTYEAVLTYNVSGISTCFSNNLGAKFTTQEYNFDNPIPINNYAHVNRTELLGDSIQWTKIKGNFIADSNYMYLAIGNFFDNNHTDTVKLRNPGKVAYYLIDNVCVSIDSNDCDFILTTDILNQQKEMPFYYENGGIIYNGLFSKEYDVFVINSEGETIFNSTNIRLQKNQKVFDISQNKLIVILYRTNNTPIRTQKILTSNTF